MMTEATNDDGALTEDEMATLFEEGASRAFVMLANHAPDKRNSVRDNAERVLDGHVHGEVTEMTFGHFGKAMWEGDLYNAMKRADGRNTGYLLDVFGLDFINAASRADGHAGYKMEDGRVVYK